MIIQPSPEEQFFHDLILFNQISKGKKAILQSLYELVSTQTQIIEIASLAKQSMPLTSYHLNGNKKNLGLIQLGLIEATHNEKKTKKYISLSTLGLAFLLYQKRFSKGKQGGRG